MSKRPLESGNSPPAKKQAKVGVLLPGTPTVEDLGLSEIPWDTLSHAYGNAEDVPAQITRYVNGGSIGVFYSNLFHQYSVYTATVAAIPVFLKILRFIDFKDKLSLLHYLHAVGVYDEELKNISEEASMAHGTCPDDEEDTRPYCFAKIAEGAPVFLAWLQKREKLDILTFGALCTVISTLPNSCASGVSMLFDIAKGTSDYRYAAMIAMSRMIEKHSLRKEFMEFCENQMKEFKVMKGQKVPFHIVMTTLCVMREAKEGEITVDVGKYLLSFLLDGIENEIEIGFGEPPAMNAALTSTILQLGIINDEHVYSTLLEAFANDEFDEKTAKMICQTLMDVNFGKSYGGCTSSNSKREFPVDNWTDKQKKFMWAVGKQQTVDAAWNVHYSTGIDFTPTSVELEDLSKKLHSQQHKSARSNIQ